MASLVRRAPRSLLSALLALALPAVASAQDYWPIERVLAQEAADRALETTGPPAAPPWVFGGSSAFTRNDPLQQLHEVCDFLVTLQVVGGPNHGGLMEGEHLPQIVQTDNTTEAIWVWSRYRRLTGDTQYDGNIAAAWTYVAAFPAYQEEGGSGGTGYYRVYNCGWAVIAEPEYRLATGDVSKLAYAQTCATYLVNNALVLSTGSALYTMTQAWAAGALYDFGVEQDDPALRATAVARGEAVRVAVEGNTPLLASESWALSGGAILWGVLRSTFRENPGGRAWAMTYGAQTKTWDSGGNWHLAHNGWYALGRWEAWKASAERAFLHTHRSLSDQLLAFDTDDDGGIPTDANHTANQDETWVTNYLAFMGIDQLRAPVSVAAASDDAQVPTGGTWTVAFAAGSTDALAVQPVDLDVLLTSPDGTSQLVPPRNLAFPPLLALPARTIPIAIPAAGPAGIWTVTFRAHDSGGALVDLDEQRVNVP